MVRVVCGGRRPLSLSFCLPTYLLLYHSHRKINPVILIATTSNSFTTTLLSPVFPLLSPAQSAHTIALGGDITPPTTFPHGQSSIQVPDTSAANLPGIRCHTLSQHHTPKIHTYYLQYDIHHALCLIIARRVQSADASTRLCHEAGLTRPRPHVNTLLLDSPRAASSSPTYLHLAPPLPRGPSRTQALTITTTPKPQHIIRLNALSQRQPDYRPRLHPGYNPTDQPRPPSVNCHYHWEEEEEAQEECSKAEAVRYVRGHPLSEISLSQPTCRAL
jgi:hypothetical protein